MGNAERGPVTRNQAKSASGHSVPPPNPRNPQPKVDGNDRRAIEAQNEDKYHTTRETLSDIKRVHNKEKKKKEQNGVEKYQTGVNTVPGYLPTLVTTFI